MTANINSIDMFNLLRQKIGEQEAKALTDFVVTEVNQRLDEKKEVLATKEDVYGIKTGLAKLEAKISESSSNTLRWVFGFFMGLALMIIGLYIRK